MAAPATLFPITKLPPGPIRPELEAEQHLSRGSSLPVSADFRADGEVESNGLDWGDYRSMSTHKHKLNSFRKQPAPEWAMNPNQLRAVLLKYLEHRWRCGRPSAPGTDAERFSVIKQIMARKRAPMLQTLTTLAKEYTALKAAGGDPKVLRGLEIQIENLDTQLRVLEQLPEKVVRIVQLYYGAGLDSVGVAMEVGMKPPHVRMIVHRMNRAWKILNSEPVPPRSSYRSRGQGNKLPRTQRRHHVGFNFVAPKRKPRNR